MALLRLLKIITHNDNWIIDIALLDNQNQLFKELSDVVRHIYPFSGQKSIFRRAATRLSLLPKDKDIVLKLSSGYDCVIFNTVMAVDYFSREELGRMSQKVLLTYEMPIAREMLMKGNYECLKLIDLIFVPTIALAVSFPEIDIPAEKVRVLHQYIEPEEITAGKESGKPGKLRVGMIGTPEWAKGIELFIMIAQKYAAIYPDSPIEFLWKGLYPGHPKYPIYYGDVVKAGVAHLVKFEGITKDVNGFYESIDVLALTSREDTFPYVMMEAALWSKPTISFKEGGGAEGFVNSYDGFTIPYLDIDNFAHALHHYATRRDLLQMHGEAARKYILEHHCDKTLIEKQFSEGIRLVLN